MTDDLHAATAEALSGLKDFQHQTVEHVHRHLFAPDGSRRFLVADEVGLGKTLIARGVIARAIQELEGKVDRIDIVYICSNAAIAKQNADRLRIGGKGIAVDTRLTLLPGHISALKTSQERLNFVAFTPSTSFELKEGLGRVDERALLYRMLRVLWGLGNKAAPRNVLRGAAGIERFEQEVDAIALEELDPALESTYALGRGIEARDQRVAASGKPGLLDEFEALCRAFPRHDSRPDEAITRRRSRLIGELRAILAASCLGALEPDLVILDEFQRFAHLLDAEDPDAALAQQMFSLPGVRTLLLSATPYRMYTPHGEDTGEDHHRDFVRTVNFLERGAPGSKGIAPLLDAYRTAMLDLGLTRSSDALRETTRALESRLRKVMVRTERLGATEDRNGMLEEVPSPPLSITATDAKGYVAMNRLARIVKHHDPVEYWKSAPYLLNFMGSDYVLTRRLEEARSQPSERIAVAKAMAQEGNHRLDVERFDGQEPIDPGNGRLRRLTDLALGQEAQRLLWLAPSLPYYGMGGAYADPTSRRITKHLVFTSWRFVPRAIASLLSHEAQRRMLGPGQTRRERRALLRFSRDRGRLSGLPVLAMMYPSSSLAKLCDPLTLARELTTPGARQAPPPVEAILRIAVERLQIELMRLPQGPQDGPADQRWYSLAPLLLDLKLDEGATLAWLNQPDLARAWAGGDASDEVDEAWAAHVEAARSLAMRRGDELGRRPDDLPEVLAELALGGPGPCLLRSMLRVVGLRVDALGGESGQKIRTSAAAAAWAFRTLYNQPEVTASLQREAERGNEEDERFWRVALRYGVNGCLQAVLDEYAHVLRDQLGLMSGRSEEKVNQIAEHMREALSLRSATVAVRDVRPSATGLTVEHGEVRRPRAHFAVRYGDQESDDGATTTRADLVRQAFNSPFWPFVLATTSVGQEGLDFHPYCHAVVHWNLPSNPVDLEQREGRVHRYKGHAVRKNVAAAHGREVLEGKDDDAWEELFRLAKAGRPAEATDIIPFWVYSTEGGARIERHVLALPSSREQEQVRRLLKSLTLYRMVFGQPRQEDMLRFLMERVPLEELRQLLADTHISLAPAEVPSKPVAPERRFA